MNPAERLQAAIEKLELHAGETWHEDSYDGFGTLAVNASNPGGGRNVAGLMGPHDAQLIVTLHRTLDAQLAILRHELARAESRIANGAVERHVWFHTADALALADAILGSDS